MRQIPDWPRLMRKTTLARYLDMSASDVEREVAAGRLPMPIRIGRADHWSRNAVDSMVERITGEGLDDWRASQPLYAQG